MFTPWKKSDDKATATAKSLQSCPTLCDPIEGSPAGSPGPWESPGKNTGVGCHFLLQCMKVKPGQLLLVWPSSTGVPRCQLSHIWLFQRVQAGRLSLAPQGILSPSRQDQDTSESPQGSTRGYKPQHASFLQASAWMMSAVAPLVQSSPKSELLWEG